MFVKCIIITQEVLPLISNINGCAKLGNRQYFENLVESYGKAVYMIDMVVGHKTLSKPTLSLKTLV